MLIAKTDNGSAAFMVEKTTGNLQPAANSFIAASELSEPAASGASVAVLNANGKFMYVIDRNKAVLHGYGVNRGKLLELAAPYPVPRSISGIVIVKP